PLFSYIQPRSPTRPPLFPYTTLFRSCTSATLEPSYVLKSLGLGDDVAHSSIRFGIGRFNTEAEVDYVADRLIDVVSKLRELSPLYEMVKEGIDLSKIQWQTEGH